MFLPSDKARVLLVDPDGVPYSIGSGAEGVFLPSTKMRVCLVDENGIPYTATSGGGGGFADQGRETILASATSKAVTFNIVGTDPIPVILYTTWASGAYIEPGSISTTGFTVIFPVECPAGGGQLGWGYVEA